MRKLLLVTALVLVAAGCEWPQLGFGPDHTGSSPDSSIDATAIELGTVVPSWHTDASTTNYGPAEAVAGGLVFASAPDGMAAFDAAGATSCSGSPVACAPRFTMATTPPSSFTGAAVANGTVVTSGFGSAVAAFDATGATCTGTPKVCAPRWTGSVTGLNGPTVAAGLVYQTVRSPDAGLVAYDLAGQNGCSGTPVVCAPLWTGYSSDPSAPVGTPTISNGVAYLVSGDVLSAFDAAGRVGCSGTPKVCTPMWTAAIDGGAHPGPAVVANGTVFVSSEGVTRTVGFDAAGVANCSGAPKTCLPTWRANQTVGPPTVANGKVYLTSKHQLAVYDATGQTGCTGKKRRTCKPLWSYTAHASQCHLPGPCDSFSGYSIAGSVVYQGFSSVATGDVTAYDATGTIGCTGTPKVCEPLRSWPAGAAVAPVIANGSIYASWSAAPGFGTSGFQALRPLGPTTLTVTPHTGLVDQQTVTVDGRGYPPGHLVLVTECSGGIIGQGIPGLLNLCTDGHGNFPPGTQNVNPDDAGNFTTTYTLISGNGGCATSPGACALIGATVDPPVGAFAGVPLTFSTP